jgi:hypothetical protein
VRQQHDGRVLGARFAIEDVHTVDDDAAMSNLCIHGLH